MSTGGKGEVVHLVFNTFKNDSRVEKTCESLARASYSVSVWAFGGKGLPQREEREGWEVFRFGNENRMTALLSLAKAVLLKASKIDVVHCNDLEPLPLGVMVKVLNFGKTRVVYDAHELETEKLAARGVRKLASKVLERCLMPFVNEMITVSEGIAGWYADKYVGKRSRLIINAPRKTEVVDSGLLRKRLGVSDEVRVFLYLGALSAGRSVEAMLDAFVGIKAGVLAVMGSGGTSTEGRRLERLVRERAAQEPNLHYLEPVPRGEVVECAASADVGLCLIEERCLSYRYCLPNKLFEYAMAGLPLVVSDLPELRGKVTDWGCGVVCPELTAEGIRRTVNDFSKADDGSMGANARRMAEAYCWERQEEKLLALYEDVFNN